jgi:ubiquitin C-terminal hydrolase
MHVLARLMLPLPACCLLIGALLQSECNRVQGKPQYKELSSHGSVLQQAAEAAAYARSWHDSLVDDLFGGQLQSTITCSTCGAQSHCFDPFLDLSVPLPRGKAQVSLQVRVLSRLAACLCLLDDLEAC